MPSSFKHLIHIVLLCVAVCSSPSSGQEISVITASVFIDGKQHEPLNHITFPGEPRLHNLVAQIPGSHQFYWPSARVCVPRLQKKLLLKRKALLVQLELLAGIYERKDANESLNQALKLKERISHWPLFATIQHGIEPDNLLGNARQNWALTNKYSHYTLALLSVPKYVTYVGLFNNGGRKPYRYQLLADALERTVSFTDGNLFEIDLQGRVIAITPANAWKIRQQPGSLVFRGIPQSELPSGFSDINNKAVELLRYWQPGKELNQSSSPCQV